MKLNGLMKKHMPGLIPSQDNEVDAQQAQNLEKALQQRRDKLSKDLANKASSMNANILPYAQKWQTTP